MASKIDHSKYDDREFLPELPVEKSEWKPTPVNPAEYIKTITTRELMGIVEAARIAGFVYDGPLAGYRMDALKEELKLREHIPGKTEAKVLRRLQAEHKMTEQQIRAIPKFKKMLSEAQ